MGARNRFVLRKLLRSPAASGTSGASVAHYFAIDFGRGLAALVVLVWHYQHFFFLAAGSDRLGINRDQQPFYRLLRPFYTDGFYAVQFFWMISGFVFAAVYLTRAATTREFAVNRFARLYPLHIVTLLMVTALQLLSAKTVGHHQIYLHTDLWHFILNLIFASHWGLESGYSYNGPVWSVSIEIVIYIAFWLTLPYLYRYGVAGPLLVASLGWILHYHSALHADEDVFRCAFYFFLGTAAFLMITALGARPLLFVSGSLGLVAVGLAIFVVRPHSTDSVGTPVFLTGILLAFCAVEAAKHDHWFRRIRWVGDNTYGIYLWHVPIQIATLIVLDRFVGSHAIALKPWFLLAFIGLTVIVARLSFVWIEAPAREWIRGKGAAHPAQTTLASDRVAYSTVYPGQ